MSITNESTAKRLETDRRPEIIPWPKVDAYLDHDVSSSAPRVRLGRKFLYYKGKRIPILQFKKAGYGKLLKLLVREIEG